MKRLVYIIVLFIAAGCNKNQMILENASVSFSDIEYAIGISGVRSETNDIMFEQTLDFPIEIENCKIVGSISKEYKDTDFDQYEWSVYNITEIFKGKVSIYDESNNLIAEWINRGIGSISDVMLYTTVDDVTYCCIEESGILEDVEGRFTHSTDDTIIRKRYTLDNNNKRYLMSSWTSALKKWEYISYYPTGQKMRYYLQQAVGDIQEGIEGYFYYNMKTVSDEYYKADGSKMSISDRLFYNNEDYIVFKCENLRMRFGNENIWLFLFPSEDKKTGRARFIVSENIQRVARCDSQYSYTILDDDKIRFYDGVAYVGWRGEAKRVSGSFDYMINNENETFRLNGRYSNSNATFILADIKLSSTWVDKIKYR